MKRYRLADLTDVREGHVLRGLGLADYLREGGLSFKAPSQRTHDHDGPGGGDRHTHEDHEVFIILQGRGVMEVDGQSHPVITGDVLVIEPGEDHHLIADADFPCINVWLHAGSTPHWQMDS